MVPDHIQKAVCSTVRQRDTVVNASWAPWWRAQTRAIHAVHREVYKDDPVGLAWATLLRDRGLEFARQLSNHVDGMPLRESWESVGEVPDESMIGEQGFILADKDWS